MNITCSAGKGVMTTEACKACALKEEHAPCGFDYTLLKALFSSSEQERRRNEVHVTDITGCLRKSFLDKTNPAPEVVHETLTRWLGTAVHAGIEGSDVVVDSELPVSWEGLVGKSDIVYKDGRLVDIKTTRWIYPEKLPYGSHVMQVNIYAYMLRKMGREINRLQIQYIDMSGPSKCRKCRVPVRWVDGELKCPVCNGFVKGAHLGAYLVEAQLLTDAEIETYVIDRKEALQGSLEMGMMPEMEAGYLCAYCAHCNVNCFPEAQD